VGAGLLQLLLDRRRNQRTPTRIMQDAFNRYGLSQEKKVTLRTATFILACTRVLQAREVRGLYP
jgi:glutamate dehydrogenase/leucine dehydrogenase